MRAVLISLMTALLFLGACVHTADLPQPPVRREADRRSTLLEEDEMLLDTCTRKQAEQWAVEAEENGWAGLKAAGCYVALIKGGKDKSLQLADAKRGRKLAEDVLKRFPQRGSAHYLAAYLTGLEAQFDPLRGLELVPIIEREALTAADLSPGLNHGGPDRMLGELYLRAPGFPVNVGDSSKAVVHYRRALSQDPSFLENRLGLVEALLAEEDLTDACSELFKLLEDMAPALDRDAIWRKALILVERMCTMLSPE